jgi:hypothetical protein
MTDFNRRDFIKKAALAASAAVVTPSLLNGAERTANINSIIGGKGGDGVSVGEFGNKLIVPKENGIRITGTFLDEISHDIPHQNWGEKEWDRDFKYMKDIGIDTVIEIRSGYRKFITWPSPYLLKKGMLHAFS